MLFGYQSESQKNIVKNNVSTSINNSVTNLNNNLIDINQKQSGRNTVDVVGNLTLNDCSINMTNKIKNTTRANLKNISRTDTNFDNTIGINITNDLKNDAKQETPGIGGGFLSSQISDQLNKASNDISTEISNDVFIKRNNSINQYSKQDARNTIAVGGDFFCKGGGGKPKK